MPVYDVPGKPGVRRVVVWSSGKRHDWYVRGTRKAALRFEATKRLELGASDTPDSRGGVPLATLCARYLAAAKDLKAETWRVRKSQLGTVMEYLGDVRSAELTTGKVSAYALERLGHVQRSTINNELRALRRLMNWARENGYPTSRPAFKWQREDQKKVRAWTSDEVQRLLAAARATSPTLLAMVQVLLNTGMRRGELLAMEWSWVDFDRDVIRIPYTDNKSRRDREVPIGAAVRSVLYPMQQDSGPVFRRPSGERYAQWPKDWWTPCRNAAGLKGGVHQARHTFASHFLAARPNLKLLGDVLGQSLARVTLQYVHFLPEHLELARDVVSFKMSRKTVRSTVRVDKMAHRRRTESK